MRATSPMDVVQPIRSVVKQTVRVRRLLKTQRIHVRELAQREIRRFQHLFRAGT